LNIPSKINKGQVEIINDVHLIKAGDRVGNSEATLLSKLNIRPFTYGLKILQVFDNGNMYDPSVLDLTDNDILTKFREGVANIACVGLAIGYPTVASLPHSLINGYNNVLAVSLGTVYSFPAAEKIKAYLENPNAFAAAAPAANTAASAPAPAPAPKKEEKPPVVEEEDDGDMGLDLFG